MNQGNIDVYSAVREAGAAARAAAAAGPCEVCGAPDSPPYVFVYGKETGSSTTTTGNSQVTTRYYADVQGQAVNLCDTCVATARQSAARRATTITAVLAAIGVLAMIGGFVVKGRVADILPGIGVAFWIFALLAYVRLRAVQTVPRQAGQQKALDLHAEELKRQGYNAFWASYAEV